MSFLLTGCLLCPSWQRDASYPNLPREVVGNRTEMVMAEPRQPWEFDSPISLDKD